MRQCWVWVMGTMVMVLANAGCVTPPFTAFHSAAGHANADVDAAQNCVTAGDALERDGHGAEAIAKYEQARQLDPARHSIAQHLAVLYDREGHDQQALAEYQRLLKEQPNDSQLLNDFGVFHYDRGRWTEAETLFRKAVQCDGQNQRACVNLGRALGQQQRYEESYAAFARVLRPADAHSNVAILMAHHGQLEKARAEISAALTLDPQHRQARIVLATLDQAKGKDAPLLAN